MIREAISVSPGGSDSGADLSQFCDSRGARQREIERSQIPRRYWEDSP